MIFEAVYNNPQQLLHIFESVYSVSDNVNLQISDECIQISEMDSGHVAFVNLGINKDDFSTYIYNKDTNSILGINLKEFIKILKVFNNGDIVKLMYNGNNTIDILINGSLLQRKFTLKLLEMLVINL